MSLSPFDEALITHYFSAQCRFERSTSGPMLDRARIMGHDSTGKRIPAAVEDWHWRPFGEPERSPTSRRRWSGAAPPRARALLGADDPNDDPEDRTQRDATMHARAAEASERSEADHNTLVRFADASRGMLAVERVSPRAKLTLEAYYGDRGDGWAARGSGYEAVDPETRATTKTPAFGPGRVASLYVLTELGAKLLTAWREKSAMVTDHMTDDDVLVSLLAVQASQPDAVRRVRLERVRDAAEALLLVAWGAWTKTEPERRARRKGRIA